MSSQHSRRVSPGQTPNGGCHTSASASRRARRRGLAEDLRPLHRRQATAANQRIAEALGIGYAGQGPGDEGDGDTGQAS